MKIVNRRAYHDYHILGKFEAGIELTGPEVKSIKKGRMSLKTSFIQIKDNQAYLINAHIPPYEFASQRNYEPTRRRRLLFHKKEIISLKTKLRQKRLTLVPLSCYTKGPWIKMEIALAKGKEKYEKREEKKRKDIEREVERVLRENKI